VTPRRTSPLVLLVHTITFKQARSWVPLALFVLATRWWTPHPRRTLLLPVVAVVVWFAVLTLGELLFDWTA